MATLRMQQEAGIEMTGSSRDEEEGQEEVEEEEKEEEEGEGEGEEEEDDIDIEARFQDGTLLPPSAIEPIGRHHGRQSRRTKDGSTVTNEKEHDVKTRVAAERQQRAHKEAKHHGKKAHAGKAGRAWTGGAGGKAKTSDKALVFNSLHF
jgi:RIO kinase 2